MKRPKILFVGPLKDYSGYASASRDYVMALHKNDWPLVTRSLRYDGGDFVPNETLKSLDVASLADVEIVIQMTTPNEMHYKPGKFNVGAFCWETDSIPQEWVNSLNQMDLVLVPCQSNLEVARRCGVVVPLEKVHYACDVDKYKRPLEPYTVPGADDSFKFLSIFQFSKKKGFDALLKAYLSGFTPQDNVSLIVKTYIGGNDKQEEKLRVKQLIDAAKQLLRIKDYPPICLIHEVMTHEDIARLYATADCYVLPSRGEGWGVPHFDALGYGLPVIATDGTAPEEFITVENGWLVDSHVSPVIDMPHPFDFLYTGRENWREPHVGHLKSCMRDAYDTWSQRENNPIWDYMCKSAANTPAGFSHEVIGRELGGVIRKYYELWKSSNVS